MRSLPRCAAKESKKIEQAGGYQFAQQTVPGGFNFGENYFQLVKR